MPVHTPHPLARTWRIMAPLAGCVGMMLAGCSSTRQASTPSNAPRATPPTRPADPSRTQSQRNDLALFAMSLLDTRYTWGGRGPATGFDCSGLVSHVYREAVGIPVKGTSADLGRQSRPIDRSQLQPGDLVFFNTLGARHSHVGVYVGNNKFVHASNPRTGVRMDALSNRYYAQRFEGAQTLLD
ncbi:C40 family peptidase [Limnohabitans sp. DM1]|uniref:C40 family peptidase n=1 Tax=Limnohabitans sp. DM1 TaxID=1597955 RepID=UPI001E5A269D|nr:C40 family peptidase [Limnohabitans sp. DM1]